MHLHSGGPLISSLGHGEQYRKLITEKYTLTSRPGDNCFQVLDDIVILENIIKMDKETYVIFRKFSRKESFGQYPFPTETIGAYTVWGLGMTVSVAKLHHIGQKYILYPEKDQFVAMPMLHTN